METFVTPETHSCAIKMLESASLNNFIILLSNYIITVVYAMLDQGAFAVLNQTGQKVLINFCADAE